MMFQFLCENISSFHAISNTFIVKTYATNIKAIKLFNTALQMTSYSIS